MTSKSATLDLDTLEAESAATPFTVKIGGQVVTLAAAEEIDYRRLIELVSDPSRFFDILVLDEAERAHVSASEMPLFKIKALVTAYMKHYGMEMPQGESRASSRR